MALEPVLKADVVQVADVLRDETQQCSTAKIE
jgi:hypothetical protein